MSSMTFGQATMDAAARHSDALENDLVEWRKIPGFSAYSVSENGLVRRDIRLHNSMPGPVSRSINDRGYWKTAIRGDDGRNRTITVHTLVALAFLGPRPDGAVICHNDSDPTNARYTNLRYGTPKSNTADAIAAGSLCMGSRHPRAKLTESDIPKIHAMWASGRFKQADIGAMFGVSQRAIWQVLHKIKWKHVERRAA